MSDIIRTRTQNKDYDEGWERIFGKRNRCRECLVVDGIHWRCGLDEWHEGPCALWEVKSP